MPLPTSTHVFFRSKQTPFLIYCLSTVFMVFFSVYAIHGWSSLWAQMVISLVCLAPLLMTLKKTFVNWEEANKFRFEISFVLVLGFLGMVNILLSEAQWDTFKAMSLFIMSGVGIYFVSVILFRQNPAIIFFYHLCTLCFVLLVSWGLFEFIQGIGFPLQRIHLFSLNPIPASSLIILLSIGPLLQFSRSSGKFRYLLILFLILGGVLIFLIGQRGSILALLVMVSIAALLKFKRFWACFLAVVLLLGAGLTYKEKLPNLYQDKLTNWDSALIRLEYYRIAYQVVRDKPIFGIGFNAPLTEYIPFDYESKIYPSDREFSFPSVTTGVRTFDNMILCFIAETGVLFGLVYLGLFVFLLRNSINLIKSTPQARGAVIIIWILLAGFMVHSMTFDSLRYPHLNWMFHSIIGLAMNLKTLYNDEL